MTPRVNQLDLSVSKRITVGRVKFDPKIDIFNALNSDDYFTVRTTTFTPTSNPALSDRVQRIGRHLPCSRAAFFRAGSFASARW